MTRYLVTGGAGFIGSNVVDHLITSGAEQVIVLDDLSGGKTGNLAAAVRSGKVQFVTGDVRDGRLVRNLLMGTDAVFHQAAIKILRTVSEPRLALDVMVNGTYEVADAAADLGVKVIAASTASVYGLAEEFPTSERHHPYDNETLYGAAKLLTEGIMRSLAATKGLEYVILRYFNVYGPRMDTTGAYTEVLPRWMDRISKGLPPLIDGDGSNSRDFIHVGDIARGNLLAAASDVSGEVFNLGSGEETTLSELAVLLADAMGSDLKPEYGPPRKADPVPRRMADISAAARNLGWVPEVDLETGLAELASWRRAGGMQ